MPSAKQIAWRKKFAKMAKSGKFKKSKSGGKQVVKFDSDKAELGRVKLLLDDYKSGRNWKSDPPRSKIEKTGTLAGWLSYAKKFRISIDQAKKVWSK